MPKKPAEAPEAPPMPSVAHYRCVSPIDHNGARIEIGDVVPMPEPYATQLLASGSLVPLEVDAPPPADDAPPPPDLSSTLGA